MGLYSNQLSPTGQASLSWGPNAWGSGHAREKEAGEPGRLDEASLNSSSQFSQSFYLSRTFPRFLIFCLKNRIPLQFQITCFLYLIKEYTKLFSFQCQWKENWFSVNLRKRFNLDLTENDIPGTWIQEALKECCHWKVSDAYIGRKVRKKYIWCIRSFNENMYISMINSFTSNGKNAYMRLGHPVPWLQGVWE